MKNYFTTFFNIIYISIINYSVIVVVLASIIILNFCLWVILFNFFAFLFVVVLVCDEAY